MKVYGNTKIEGSITIHDDLALESLGHHFATITANNHLHPHAHSEFNDGLSTTDTQIINSYNFEVRLIYQPDYSTTITTNLMAFSFISPSHILTKNIYYQVGAGGALADVRIQIWEGTDESGRLFFDETYDASLFVADAEIQLPYAGYVEYEFNTTYYLKYSSSANFSLKGNAEETIPWFAADVSHIREDNLLQTSEWVDGLTWNVGDLFIDGRRIYVCDTTGVQNGTFLDNITLWHDLGALALSNEQ